jgi:hypothetical protein
MVNSFPTNETLGHRCVEIRAEGLRSGDGGKAGTEFYRDNRTAMNEGADVVWTERFNHDELSAIQNAMNLKLQDEVAFFAEYQNEPLPEERVDTDQLTAEQVVAKSNGMVRCSISLAANHLIAFIDVQQKTCSALSPPGRTTSLITLSITERSPIKNASTSRSATRDTRSPLMAPVWKVPSMPAWNQSPPSTTSKPKAEAEPSTNGKSAPNNPTSIDSIA